MTLETGKNSHIPRATGRVAGRAIRRNRFVNATVVATGKTFSTWRRVLSGLILDVTGFLFTVFAVIGGFATFREYQAYVAGKMGLGRAILGACFTIVFAYFGLTSFWRSRRSRD